MIFCRTRAGILTAAVFLAVLVSAGAQSRTLSQGTAANRSLSGPHNGPVSALIEGGDRTILSAGEDGFLGVWNVSQNAAVDRFQLSAFSIIAMARRPDKTQIAVAETDGMGLYRISVWDYESKRKFYTLRFKDPISYISYSAGGNFLIVARSGRTGVVFLDPERGTQLQSPDGLTGTVTFAATGKSERSMICYSPQGQLSYWNLETGETLRRLSVTENITSPILFSNNRFFAGFDYEGLVVFDATSGTVLGRNSEIREGSLISINPESTEFICLSAQGDTGRMIRFRISNTGRLEIRTRRTFSSSVPRISSAVMSGNDLVLGCDDGQLRVNLQSGTTRVMQNRRPVTVREAAASGNTLALMNNDGTIGFIPLDFYSLESGTAILFEDAGTYTHITADTKGPGTEAASEERFLLWQDNSRYVPILRNSSEILMAMDELPMQFPLRAASVLGSRALFLDVMGNITILSLEDGKKLYSYSSIGALDTAFVDDRNIIIGRSGVTGNTPFLMVDTGTGETVPLNYPASIGARVYRGASGRLYGAAVDQNPGNVLTRIITLQTSNPADSRPLVEYQGEDTSFGIAECAGSLATTLGGDGATIYNSAGGFRTFERSPGLPVKLVDGAVSIIAIDEDGNITWHNPHSGEILASLRIYSNEWILSVTHEDSVRGTVRGIR
ncbi:WD40 repeat domain-containing protein [Breznakiella homolactica]|uniref:WD40 repeat domain-containing protein n=1 Tax=Breznakiella homolactica TaxID=2798577 RepID=A0A7T7XKM0_9SPIR|nr:WD40 repeat domain-containing protein [Breznakiella homolactica]QQO08081.1 WD40 repeat domain-containing protein [Breznakiella homolactica]